MYEIKTEDVYEGFNNDNHSTKSKYYDNGNRLVVGKMKDGTPGVSIEEFVRLNPKMYLYLVDTKNLLRRNFLEMCKQKCCCDNKSDWICRCFVEWEILETLHEYGIQDKCHRIGTYEVKKFLCLDLIKKYTSKTMDVMDKLLVARVNYTNKKTFILITIKKKLFCQANYFNFLSGLNSFFIKHIKFEKQKKMVRLMLDRRWEKSNRTNFYWRIMKVCVGSIQYEGIETICWGVRR